MRDENTKQIIYGFENKKKMNRKEIAWKKIGEDALTSAVLGGLAGYFLAGEAGNSQYVMGMNIPTSVIIGGSCAAGSVAGDLAHRYILPQIPYEKKYGNMEALALGVAATGGVTAITMSMAGANSESLIQAMMLGVGSKLGAQLVTDYLFPGWGKHKGIF